ncbi:MAG: FmdB family zinc ribbon protein [Bacteroidota bacterium]
MPTYEYICKNCGHELEELQSMKETPLTLCPNCKTNGLARVLGGGGGLIFKGTGFYLTDYKKEQKSAAPDKKEEKKESTPDTKVETPKPSTPETPKKDS